MHHADYDAHQALASDSVTYWAKDALRTLLQRDPVDAAADAELVARIMRDRAAQILGE